MQRGINALPRDLERHLATFLPLVDLARWNTVRRNVYQDLLLQRARIHWKEQLAQRWTPQPTIPRFCVACEQRNRTVDFINLVDHSTKRLHYCGNCLTTLFMSETSPLFDLYPRIADVT